MFQMREQIPLERAWTAADQARWEARQRAEREDFERSQRQAGVSFTPQVNLADQQSRWQAFMSGDLKLNKREQRTLILKQVAPWLSEKEVNDFADRWNEREEVWPDVKNSRR